MKQLCYNMPHLDYIIVHEESQLKHFMLPIVGRQVYVDWVSQSSLKWP